MIRDNKNIMVDLETMGNVANSAIIAVGAVRFSIHGTTDEFYQTVDLESSVEAGGVMTPSTVLWWMQQSDAARAEFARPGAPLVQVLLAFRDWLGTDQNKIWGNGASFDNVILSSAYQRLLLPTPWKFWNDCCYRTVKAMNKQVPFNGVAGTAHNALDDAKAQALHLIEMMKARQ